MIKTLYTDNGFVSPPRANTVLKGLKCCSLLSLVLQLKERRYQTVCIFSVWLCELLLGVTPTGSGGVIFSLFEVSAEINIIRCKLAEAWNRSGGYTINVNGGQPRERDASCLVSTRVCFWCYHTPKIDQKHVQKSFWVPFWCLRFILIQMHLEKRVYSVFSVFEASIFPLCWKLWYQLFLEDNFCVLGFKKIMITYKYANVFYCTGLWSDPDGNKTLLILCSRLRDGAGMLPPTYITPLVDWSCSEDM